MRTPHVGLPLLAAWLGIALVAYSQSFLTNGLVGYYPFNGNADDASGVASNGVVVGTSVSPTNDHLGTAAGALHFGGGSYVSVTPTPFNLNSNWAISFWCKLDSGAEASVNNFVSTGNDNNGGLNIRYIGFQSPTWQLITAAPGIPAWPGDLGPGCGGNATNLPTGWNLLTARRSGNSFEMFLDGVLIASNSASTVGTTLDAGSLWLGREEGGLTYDLVGSLSGIRIYNRALSSSEVQQLYQYESQPLPCTPHAATATASVVNGFVVGATITDPGCGYTNSPLVLIQGGGGTGAAATAAVSNGVLLSITITDAGSGYTNAPAIYIYSPPFVPQITLVRAVKPMFSALFLGTNYQLQVSTDLTTWTNQGVPFVATNDVMEYPQYFDVDNWGQLFFRVQVSP